MTQQFVTFPPSAVTTMPLENPPDHSQVVFFILLMLILIDLSRPYFARTVEAYSIL